MDSWAQQDEEYATAMTRNLPEPQPDNVRKPGEQRVFDKVRDLLRWANLLRYSGSAYVQVNFNQGGPTAAEALKEEPLPPNI